MDTLKAIQQAIARCGRPVQVGAASFTACIFPRLHTNLTFQPQKQTVFGRQDPREYLYYGPVDGGGELVAVGSLLAAGQDLFVVLICEDFYWQGQPAYRWAALKRMEEEDGPVYRA